MSRELVFKWSGREFAVLVDEEDTVSSLKHKLEKETNVDPKRQKILGLKARGGRPASDEVPVTELLLKPGQKLMLMGVPDAQIEALDKQAEVAPHIQGDFDVQEGELQDIELKDQDEVQEKLARRVASVDVKVLNPPRPGKKCLVLDIDYTLFDLGSSAERPEELARPYLHEFLEACYEHYDIVIWSATNMKWVEVKMRELGVLSHPRYKLTFMLDHRAMVTVRTEKYGVFDCKPLAFIWAKFPDLYTEANTVMLDDLRRNYVLNRQNGLVIRPFRKAHSTRATDRELLKLSLYLCKIAQHDSLAHLKHRRWEQHIESELRELRRRQLQPPAAPHGQQS